MQWALSSASVHGTSGGLPGDALGEMDLGPTLERAHLGALFWCILSQEALIFFLWCSGPAPRVFLPSIQNLGMPGSPEHWGVGLSGAGALTAFREPEG